MSPAMQSQKTLQLTEWQTDLVADEVLSDADRRLALELQRGEEGRLIVDELRSGVRVTARSWVGVVRFERFEVRVVPKLAGDNLGLVQMIELATGLDALRRSSSVRTLAAQDTGLLDLIALLLAEEVELILRDGVLADYVEREDELPVVRGRLLADRQLLRRFGQIDCLACRFDEHEQDIAENQILAAALSLCSPRVTHEAVRRRVRRLLAIFQEVCRLEEFDAAAARRNLIYHRLNERYRDAHEIAWPILDCLGTKDLLSPGSTRCFAFLIDMNRLFEMFVYRVVEILLRTTNLRVHYQRGDRSIIVDTATQQPYSRVVPDLLVEDPARGLAGRLAIDAKYKLYDEKKLSSGDVYQAFLYAYAYGEANGPSPPTALVLYPSSAKSAQAIRLRVRSTEKLAAADILALGVSIPSALAELRSGNGGAATNALLQAIQQGLGLSTPAAA